MSPEKIDAQLARKMSWHVPETVADALTTVFRDDWRARHNAYEADPKDDNAILSCSFIMRFEVPAAAAREHLLRLMEAERRLRQEEL